MTSPIATSTAPTEPQLPALPATTGPMFIPGTTVSYFWYELVDGTVGKGSRTVVTALDGTQVVTERDSAGAVMLPAAWEPAETPEVVQIAGTVASSGGGTATSDTTEATQLLVKTAVEAINTKTVAPNTARVAAMQTGIVTAGTVAAGAQEVGFRNTGTTNATVAGGTLAPSEYVSFSTHGNDTLGAIAYIASATAILTIASVR